MPDLAAYLSFATVLARRAGEVMRSSQLTLTVERKADHTPVTEVDRAINALVIQEVRAAFSDHGILGEEESYQADAEWTWVCDPIDGTAAFIMHLPLSAFSLALTHNGEPVVAVIYNPWTDSLYTAVKGGGTWLNGIRLHVSERAAEHVRIVTRGINAFNGPFGSVQAKELLQQKKWTLVHLSSIAYKGCLIAEGALDGTVYNHTGAHDIAALYLLVTEAGGKVTDLAGKPQAYNRAINGAVITNGLIHNELLAVAAELDMKVAG